MKAVSPSRFLNLKIMRWLRTATAGALVLSAALSLGGCRWPWADEGSSSSILLSGSIEARETDVAFQVSGRIANLSVDEGDAVTVGEPVASLDTSDYQLSLDRAQAEADVSKAALVLLEAGPRHQEVKVAAAAVTQAEAQLKFARSETKRIEKLIPKKLAAQDQLDRARLQEDVARATLTQAKQQLALIKEGARKEQIDEARATVEAKEKAVAVAKQQLSYAALKSPVSGSVTVRLMEPGEVAAPGQAVLRVASLAHPWVRVYVNEKDLPRIRLGQVADVTVDGLPGKVFKGKVSFISPEAEFTPKTVETRDVRVDLVYRVKVEVNNPDGALKIGMPADVSLTPASS